MEKIQELESERNQLLTDKDQLRAQLEEVSRNYDESHAKCIFVETEKKKLHEQLLHYEVMETEYKALEKELKYLK